MKALNEQMTSAINLSIMKKTFNEYVAELMQNLDTLNSMNLTAEARDHGKKTLVDAYIIMMAESQS